MECFLSNIINTQKVGTIRNRMMRALAVTLRELTQMSTPNSDTLDMIAFIVMTLDKISETVEQTTTAWEKRGYWVKADKFRLQWEWSKDIAATLNQQLLKKDWGAMPDQLARLSQAVSHVKVSKNHRVGKPWEGAYDKYLRNR